MKSRRKVAVRGWGEEKTLFMGEPGSTQERAGRQKTSQRTHHHLLRLEGRSTLSKKG